MADQIAIASRLMDIEAELRQLGQWASETPTPEALASTEPFCVDTLSFTQWLQFIFLPRMYALLEQNRLPPGPCSIAPLAEEYFKNGNLDTDRLIRHIAELDRLLTRGK